VRHSKAEKAEQNGQAEPGTMTEGPNDWKWQVGLATYEWKAAEDPVFTGLGTDGPG
jgi:hypothetical protein